MRARGTSSLAEERLALTVFIIVKGEESWKHSSPYLELKGDEDDVRLKQRLNEMYEITNDEMK